MSLNIEKASNSIDTISHFEKDRIFFFCYKKLNKLLKAIIILTKDKEDNHIVKDTLEVSISVIENSVAFFIVGREVYRNLSIEKILILSALIEGLSSADFISENNAKILISEYGSVANIISKTNSIIANSGLNKDLKKDYFGEISDIDLEKRVKENLERNMADRIGIKDSIKDIHLSYKNDFNRININKSYIKSNKESSKNDRKKYIYSASSKIRNQENKKDVSERTKSILNIIRDNKSVTIKDISNTVSDISEKTIQRELSSMVLSGVLKREGERRWSRYSLA